MANDKKGLSRRDFLKTTGIATGAVLGGGVIGGLVGYNVKPKTTEKPATAVKPDVEKGGAHQRGLMYFTTYKEFNVLSQAVERIFPEDELGPGAIGLGVPFFIDNQLAGNYGNNTREYMQGPFFPGEPTQGYQSGLTRAEIFRQGIVKLDAEAMKRFDTAFEKLEGNQMDEILTAFQKNEVEMKGVASGFFFRLLRQATLEGAYADPIYNGNINMDGWRMKGFPGHQMSYLDEIEKEGFLELEPQSVSTLEH